MSEPDPRHDRLAEYRQRLPGLVRAIQEPGVTPERMAELSAEFLAVHGAALALSGELFAGPD
jgi:hypothetical protein